MQIVNILGDDRGYLAGAVERCECPMTASWARSGKCPLHGEAAAPGFLASLWACNKLVEGDWPVAGPYSAWRTKIRYPALGRDSGARKRNDDGSFGDHVAQPFNAATNIGRNHRSISYSCKGE